MSKCFNVEGLCNPTKHYMVNLDSRLSEIKQLVDNGKYFTINRARQYGKTTVLHALSQFLKSEYLVVSLDFQKLGDAKFRNENVFSVAFAKIFIQAMYTKKQYWTEALEQAITELQSDIRNNMNTVELFELFLHLSDICRESEYPIVLIIDEVDSAMNNQVFIDFLAQLRAYYIDRENAVTFHSVILAGVYDVKNLKKKIRSEDEHKVNSPWNIAANFNVQMSFSVADIESMLVEYEEEHYIGMDITVIANMIYDYTSGYPFLVSRICKIIDEELVGSEQYPDYSSVWTSAGVLEAVKQILSEKNTLFESLIGKIEEYPNLKEILYSLLFTGRNIMYNPDEEAIDIAMMFGFVKNYNGNVVVANRIFETRLYNMFLTNSSMQATSLYKAALRDKNQFIQYGHLDMELVLEKFITHFDDLYGDQPDTFKEEDGRRYFLLYLRPIINGTGSYYIESRTRNLERTDVIINYNNEQFIIELKIWHGEKYNTRGEKQLIDYLNHYHLKRGYMLSFNFNKNKQIGMRHLQFGEQTLVEAIV